MNTNINPPARLFPYVALAAFHMIDSGDGDADLYDKIEDTLHTWHPDLVRVKRLYTSCDFSYMLELPNEVIVANLGTEGTLKAWGENVRFWPLFNDGRHDGFNDAGDELCDTLFSEVMCSRKPISFVDHSRGCPRGIIAAEKLYDKTGVKIPNYAFNGPPAYTRRGRGRWNKKGLYVLNIRNSRDIVDNLGFFLLVHVGKKIKLPFARTWVNSIPLIGWAVGGHAYSSDYEALVMYYADRGMWDEVHYLKEHYIAKV
jgi:hypothetical protein